MSSPDRIWRPPGYYGWVVVGCMFLLLWTAQGLTLTGIPSFDEMVLRDLQMSRGALKFRDLIMVMCAGLSGPLIGLCADRFGARAVICAGLVALSFSFVMYGYVQSPAHIYLIHVLMGFCFSATNIVVILVILANWFQTKRGIALGIALAGTSLGSAFFPQLNTWLLTQMDWRVAMQTLGILPLLLIPIVILLARPNPNAPKPEKGPSSPAFERGYVFKQLTSPNFLLLTAAAFLTFYTANAFIQHALLFLRDIGADPAAAATGFSIIFMASLTGKIVSGFLVERWQLQHVWMAFQAIMLVGAFVVVGTDIDGARYGLALVGFGWGGAYSLTQLSISYIFPDAALGRMMGVFVIIEALASGMGSWLTGLLFDANGNYTIAFIMAGTVMLGALASTRLVTVRKTS